jgi:uncharacterized membrane protein YfhO
MLVLSEIYYPGWVAYIDGVRARVQRANWNLRTVPMPAGTHRVLVRFEPGSFLNGMAITALTLLIALGVLTWAFVRRRRTHPG